MKSHFPNPSEPTVFDIVLFVIIPSAAVYTIGAISLSTDIRPCMIMDTRLANDGYGHYHFTAHVKTPPEYFPRLHRTKITLYSGYDISAVESLNETVKTGVEGKCSVYKIIDVLKCTILSDFSTCNQLRDIRFVITIIAIFFSGASIMIGFGLFIYASNLRKHHDKESISNTISIDFGGEKYHLVRSNTYSQPRVIDDANI